MRTLRSFPSALHASIQVCTTLGMSSPPPSPRTETLSAEAEPFLSLYDGSFSRHLGKRSYRRYVTGRRRGLFFLTEESLGGGVFLSPPSPPLLPTSSLRPSRAEVVQSVKYFVPLLPFSPSTIISSCFPLFFFLPSPVAFAAAILIFFSQPSFSQCSVGVLVTVFLRKAKYICAFVHL